MLFDDKRLSKVKFNVAKDNCGFINDKESILSKWSSILGNKIAAKYAVTYGMLDGDDSKAKKVYAFITKKFLSKGFTEEEAKEFMCKNYRLFGVDINRIASVLSICDLVGLGDEVFFEQPDFICGACDSNSIYLAVKMQCKKEPSVTELLETAATLPEQKERTYSESKDKFFTTMYLKNLFKEKEAKRELK